MAIDLELTFEEFLIAKKIDPKTFKNEESHTFKEWEALYQSVHPDSFIAQKKFHINPIRRRFGLPL